MRGLIIDPYNYIEQSGEEHNSISQLSRITAFARPTASTSGLSPAPRKCIPRDGTYTVPKGMNISSSAAWLQRLSITVQSGFREIHCWKSRFKWTGNPGCGMSYI